MTDTNTAADRYQAARNNQESTQRGGVSSKVNERKTGVEADPNAYLERNREEAPEHHTCSPDCEHWEEEEDTRSNREKLLDGETVEVSHR